MKFAKINISDIIRDHIKTHDSKDWYFIIFPIVAASTATYLECRLDKDMVSILNTGFSIFLGLFFNVIVLLFDIVKKTIQEKKDNIPQLIRDTEKNNIDSIRIIDNVKLRLLKETLINICFLIFLSIIGIIFGYFSLFTNIKVAIASNFVVYLITTLFFLTVFMVLKRIYTLFIREFNDLTNNKI